MLTESKVTELTEVAKRVRRETIHLAQEHHFSHYGGSFSAVETMVALYKEVMTPQDQFVLSKGHACFPWYVLLRDKGYDPKMMAHPDIDPENGICATTGSLGHGLPIAIGKAWGRKIQKFPGKVYVLMGDGECQEGTTWESILLAPVRKLDNLVAIVDNNRIQGSDRVSDVVRIRNPLVAAAIEAGWSVSSAVDGHDYYDLIPALTARSNGKPRLIIANTVKGKGVSFMEDQVPYHSKVLNNEQVAQALEELK